jgi:hypothetical protein
MNRFMIPLRFSGPVGFVVSTTVALAIFTPFLIFAPRLLTGRSLTFVLLIALVLAVLTACEAWFAVRRRIRWTVPRVPAHPPNLALLVTMKSSFAAALALDFIVNGIPDPHLGVRIVEGGVIPALVLVWAASSIRRDVRRCG